MISTDDIVLSKFLLAKHITCCFLKDISYSQPTEWSSYLIIVTLNLDNFEIQIALLNLWTIRCRMELLLPAKKWPILSYLEIKNIFSEINTEYFIVLEMSQGRNEFKIIMHMFFKLYF